MKRKLKMPNEAEEAAIQRGIAADPENPEWTKEDFARARTAAEVLGNDTVAALTKRRGPQRAPTKELVSVRLDPDLLAALRAGGRGWQTKMNDTLRRAMKLDKAD